MFQRLFFVNLSNSEWRLVIDAVAAYQHRADYRDVHERLLAQYDRLIEMNHAPSEMNGSQPSGQNTQ